MKGRVYLFSGGRDDCLPSGFFPCQQRKLERRNICRTSEQLVLVSKDDSPLILQLDSVVRACLEHPRTVCYTYKESGYTVKLTSQDELKLSKQINQNCSYHSIHRIQSSLYILSSSKRDKPISQRLPTVPFIDDFGTQEAWQLNKGISKTL